MVVLCACAEALGGRAGLADVGLHAHGYRTLTSKPGHYQTAIQTLPTTLEPMLKPWFDWTNCASSAISQHIRGDIIPKSAVSECLSQAESLTGCIARNVGEMGTQA